MKADGLKIISTEETIFLQQKWDLKHAHLIQARLHFNFWLRATDQQEVILAQMNWHLQAVIFHRHGLKK